MPRQRSRPWRTCGMAVVVAALLSAAVAVVGAPRALAGADPGHFTDTFVVDETSFDEVTTEFCGFPVEQHLQARFVVVSTFSARRHLDIFLGPSRYTWTNLESGESVEFLEALMLQFSGSTQDADFEEVVRFTGLNYLVKTSQGTFTSSGSVAYGLRGTLDENGALLSVEVFGHVLTSNFFHAYPVLCVFLGAVDTDHDYLPDNQGIRTEEAFRTDPNNPDTDGDGYLDGIEVANETNPRKATSHPSGAIGDPDKDDDFLHDGEEVLVAGTDPTDPDTDDDGYLDGLEWSLYGTDPTNRRSHP